MLHSCYSYVVLHLKSAPVFSVERNHEYAYRNIAAHPFPSALNMKSLLSTILFIIGGAAIPGTLKAITIETERKSQSFAVKRF